MWVVYIIKLVKSGLYNLYPSALKEVEKPHNSEKAHLLAPCHAAAAAVDAAVDEAAAAAAVPVIMHPSSTTNIRFVPKDKLFFVGS